MCKLKKLPSPKANNLNCKKQTAILCHMNIRSSYCTFTKAAMLIACVAALTDTVVASSLIAPNNLANTDGNSSNAFPFVGVSSTSGSAGVHYQEVFSASQFTSLPGSALITAITFRPEAGQTAKSISYLNFTLELSTTSAQPDALSTSFADNIGANNTTVYSGAITLSTSVSGPVKGGPEAFDINIPFQTGFLYQPGQGNLLIDLFLSGPSAGSGTGIQIDTENTSGDSISRLVAVSGVDNLNSGIGRASTEAAPALFTYTVPEPSTFTLCAGIALSLCAWVRRRGSAWRGTSI